MLASITITRRRILSFYFFCLFLVVFSFSRLPRLLFFLPSVVTPNLLPPLIPMATTGPFVLVLRSFMLECLSVC